LSLKSEKESSVYEVAPVWRSTTRGAATSRAIVIRQSAWLVRTIAAENDRERVFSSIGLKSW